MSVDALDFPGRVAMAEARAQDGARPVTSVVVALNSQSAPLVVDPERPAPRVISRAMALSQLPADMTEDQVPQVAFLYLGLLLHATVPLLEQCTNRSLSMDVRIAQRELLDLHLRALVNESARAGAVLAASPVFQRDPNRAALSAHWNSLSAMIAHLDKNVLSVSPYDLASELVAALYTLRDSAPEGVQRNRWHAVLARMVNPSNERGTRWWKEYAEATKEHRKVRALYASGILQTSAVLEQQHILGQRFRKACDRMRNPLCLPEEFRYVWVEKAPDSNLVRMRAAMKSASDALSRGVLLAEAELDALMQYFANLDTMRE